MLLQVGSRQRALDHEVQGPRQQQAHVAPQATQVVGAATPTQDEVNRVTESHDQGFPGKAAVLVQLVPHTQRSTSHRHGLQARQALAVYQASGQDHGQRQEEVAH
ncbi:hypothetical protein D3C75_1203160 [compost metagenome]